MTRLLSVLLLISVINYYTADLKAQNKPSSTDAIGGTIQGVITNRDNGAPINEAIVSVVKDAVTVLTNATGEFVVSGIKPGYTTLYVTADGYKPIVTESFMLTASAPSTINLSLEPQLVSLKEVMVTASPFVPTSESPVSMRRIGTEEIDMTPGANRDVSKVVQSAPGVIATPMQRNDILVRGGGANENKYFLDGIEIPVLNHFAVQGGSGGNASLVNTDLLNGVNFYTGAFPAKFSNGLSSVMDMQMDRGNEHRLSGKLTVGASDVGLSVDSPISKNGKTTLLASYRRSYLQMLFKVLGLPFLPTYNDYQFKISTKFNARTELYFIGLGSFDNNRLNTKLTDPDDDQKYILGYLPENKQSSYVIGAGFRRTFDRGVLRAVLSRNNFDNLLYKYTDNNSSLPKTLNYDTRQGDTRLRVELDKWFDSGYRFSFGMGGGTGDYHSNNFSATFTDGDSPTSKTYKSRINLIRYEAFATVNKSFFNESLSLLLGLRADGVNYSSQMSNPLEQLSPRLSVSYKISPRVSLNGSVARYYQEPPYTTMGYRNNAGEAVNKSNGLKYISANHFVLGAEYRPNPSSKFGIEGFFKQYGNYPISLIDSLPVSTGDFADYTVGDVPVRSVGKGRAYGAELSYRHLNLFNSVINISYTLLWSEFNKTDKNLRPINEYVSSSWDVRHILNVSVIHKFERNWVLGAKWYYIGGFPYTPYDEALSSRIDAWNVRRRPYIDYAQYNSLSLKPYHQLDVRVDKMWFFKSLRVGFYIDIQNLYNFSTDGQAILMPETDLSGAYIPDPSRPGHYKMKTVEKNEGGTILPTLGLVIEF